MASHEPMRICVGCRTRATTQHLVRIAFQPPGDSRSLVLDERSVLPGRGAWVHPEPECLATALRKRAFARAFRGHVETGALEGVLVQWQQLSTTPANIDESGSEI